MPQFTVYKGSKHGEILKASTYREIGPDEVLIKVTHSGLCGTDVHYKHSDMGLGHEGAGVVEEIGSAVKNLSKGNSVGWGYMHNTCGICKPCLVGKDILCPDREVYGQSNHDQGSFSTYGVWKASFVFKIPDQIDRLYAAPLMCGGATVYSALRVNQVQPEQCVGIIGVGGLGHLAIQFAAKMGCHVVVFSGTDSKRDEALSLGAHEFYATKGVSRLNVKVPVDHLLVTTSSQPDWSVFVPVMAPEGTIYPLSASADAYDLKIPYMPLLDYQLRIQGSMVAARQVHRDMLSFAARHDIKPIVEEFPMTVDGIVACMKKLEDGEMRYRGVLVVQDSE